MPLCMTHPKRMHHCRLPWSLFDLCALGRCAWRASSCCVKRQPLYPATDIHSPKSIINTVLCPSYPTPEYLQGSTVKYPSTFNKYLQHSTVAVLVLPFSRVSSEHLLWDILLLSISTSNTVLYHHIWWVPSTQYQQSFLSFNNTVVHSWRGNTLSTPKDILQGIVQGG